MWAAQYYSFNEPRRWINFGGLGTMGVGLPYAMGVQMANPDRQIAVITGEASIQMNIQDLSTCRQYRQIERAHVCTPDTNAHIDCRIMLENTKKFNTPT